MNRFSHKNLILAVIVSLALHISLVLLVPEIRITPLSPRLRVISVKMIKLVPPKPKKRVRKKPKKLVSKKKIKRKKKSVKKKKPPKKVSKKKKKPVNYSISQITAKLGKRKVRPQISLSSLKIPEITPQALPLPDEVLPINESDLFEQENLLDAFTETDFSPIKFNDAKQTPVPEEKLPKPIKSDSRISWGKGMVREYVYRPDPPEYYSKIEGEVEIKFWVDPGGNVTQALPLKRLDAGLEQISIDFIKRWRFNPLRGGADKDQWGVLTLKFQHN